MSRRQWTSTPVPRRSISRCHFVYNSGIQLEFKALKSWKLFELCKPKWDLHHRYRYHLHRWEIWVSTKKPSPIQGCVLCPLRPKSSQEPRRTAMFIQVSNWFSFPKNWATDWYVFFSKSSHEMFHFLNAACLEAVVWTGPVGWTLSAVRRAAIRRPTAVAPWGDKPGTAPHNTRHATPARARADWEKPQKLKVWTGT